MTATSLITLPETMETSLIVGIMLAYLGAVQQLQYRKLVWGGVGAGVLFSLVFAAITQWILTSFTGSAEQVYEGIMMLIAAVLLTSMILWMLNQRRTIKSNIEQRVHQHIERGHPVGIFVLAFVSTAREGMETVIFLQAAILQTGGIGHLLAGIAGVGVAIGIGFVIFKGLKRIPLHLFFSATSIFLIVFAAGLVTHGVHEFIEAGVLPTLGSFPSVPVLSAAIDALRPGLELLFGFSGPTTWMELLTLGSYVAVVYWLWKTISRQYAG